MCDIVSYTCTMKIELPSTLRASVMSYDFYLNFMFFDFVNITCA